MTRPESFVNKGEEYKVCLLKRSIYDLKQSPRHWYKRFDTFIMKNDFNRCKHDERVYLKETEDGVAIYLLFYIDNMLIACNSKEEIKRVKMLLNSEFEMKDIRVANMILGMQITGDMSKGILFINHKHYLAKVLMKFNMDQ